MLGRFLCRVFCTSVCGIILVFLTWDFSNLVCAKVLLTPPPICSCTQTGTSRFAQTTQPCCTPDMAPRFIFMSSNTVAWPQAQTYSSFSSITCVSMADKQDFASSASTILLQFSNIWPFFPTLHPKMCVLLAFSFFCFAKILINLIFSFHISLCPLPLSFPPFLIYIVP